MNTVSTKGSQKFTFIDLFAGIGGFHLAMRKLGGECVFASELQPELQELYYENFKIKCAGDINKIDKKVVNYSFNDNYGMYVAENMVKYMNRGKK